MVNKEYVNINSYFDYELVDPKTKKLFRINELSNVFPESIAELELSTKKVIKIPKKVLDTYSKFRPTPLFRAKNFEKAIGTNCEIYIKDEGSTPTGNHKVNSAYLIAYLCKKDGVKTITTETTGNWGIALAIADKKFGLKTICFIDYESNKKRPDRKKVMEKLGAEVIVVNQNKKYKDLLTLSADAALKYTKKLKNAAYIFGSVYGYFVITQSIISLEAKEQLKKLGKYPDIVIGSCGGGANLLGISAAFIVDILEKDKKIEIFSAESENCPILTKGIRGLYSIDTLRKFPLLNTYGLKSISDKEYIGGLGSTIVASAVSYFHLKRIIKAETFSAEEAKNAAELFHKTENKWVALETGYQLAGVIKKAKQNQGKIILVNISSGKNDSQFYRGSK